MRCVSCVSGSLAALASVVFALLLASAARSETTAVDAAASLASAPPPPGLVMLWHDGSEDAATTLDRLERAGLHVAVALPPHVFYVRESPRATLPAGFVRRAAPAVPSLLPLRLEAPDVDLFGGRDDVLPPFPRTPGAGALKAGTLHGLPFGARYRDTSEFMIGRVAVSILFPESDGSTDPSHYDWTPALRDSVVRAAVRGLAHWSAFAAQRGIDVTFALEVHAGLATRYEP